MYGRNQISTDKKSDRARFITDIQAAFQKGFEDEYGACDETILPTENIEQSFGTRGAEAYFAVSGGDIVGGAVIVVDTETNLNHLDLLYVNNKCQSRGAGLAIWKAIEALHPETELWETCTPYFDKRNIHFYVNKCGFHIVEFYNIKHRDPNSVGENVGGMPEEIGENFFRFEKVMKRRSV